MQFIQWTRDSEGTATVEKATPYVDGPKTRQWRLVLSQRIESREQTHQLPMFPAADQAFQDAVDEMFSTTSKIKPLKGARVEMDLAFETGDQHADPPTHRRFEMSGLSAEVRQGQLKTQPGAKVVQATVWLHGVDLEHSDAIVRAQGWPVHVTIRALAPEAFLLGDGATELEDGQLVAGHANGEKICGRLLRLDKEGHAVVDDFGAIFTLAHDPAPLALTLKSVDDLDVEEHIRAYEQEVKSLGAVPTWQDVLTAATAQWADGQIARPSGGTLYLNAATFGVAADMRRTTPVRLTAER